VVEKKAMTDGEIKKLDKESGKVTIKHGEIKDLDMPPMTMVFRVKDPSMLEKVKVGDKINFSADKINGNFTVTEFESAK
jgi:Cu(I)/Ag(I) efflux system periplasmic protein CusF